MPHDATSKAPLSYISRMPDSDFPRALCILGSTGSIGVNALNVVREHPSDFIIVALAGARNIKRLAEQAIEFRPPYLGVLDGEGADELAGLLPGDYRPEILTGQEGYIRLATLDEVGMVLAAQVGAAGLPPSMAAAEAGKDIALANKESLVLAGDLFRETCERTGATVLPVDSEHNALFQCLSGHNMACLKRMILTASGGPFRGRDRESLATVTREQALKHPNWAMGAKITIDSSTLMNKGLEFIEARHLYGLPVDKLDVVVHPQSIIHSMVEYHDGSVLAHLGPPDMRIPIAYCMTYPRCAPLPFPPLDLVAIGQLTFEEPDLHAFECLALAMDAMERGPGYPVVMNGANEIAVERFLAGEIAYLDIPALVGRAMDELGAGKAGTLKDILSLDQLTRKTVSDWIDLK